MPLNLASPGIVVREVDLTVGRVDATNGAVGALVAPFAKGPVDEPVLVGNEADLLSSFGEPYNTDKHYEDWLVASSYLAYGGNMRVVRADDDDLKNAVSAGSTEIKIKSLTHYNQLGYDENTIADAVVVARNPGSWANGIKVAVIDGLADQILSGVSTNASLPTIEVGYGVTQAISSTLPGAGSTTVLDGHLKGVITAISGTNISVKVLAHVSAGGTTTEVDYQPSGVYAFSNSGNVAIHTTGETTSVGSTSYTAQSDWFDQQTISLTGSTVYWNTLADRPGTSAYAGARDSRFDEVHVVVYDDNGSITGNAGTLLEKHVALSKAKDAEYSLGSTSYWRKYLANNSRYIFGGSQPSGTVATGFSSGFTLETDTGWDQNASGITFAGNGASTLTMSGSKNYYGGTDITASGSLTSNLAQLASGYDLFEKPYNYHIDFLLMV